MILEWEEKPEKRSYKNTLFRLGDLICLYTENLKGFNEESESEDGELKTKGKFLRFKGKTKLKSIKIDPRVGEVQTIRSSGKVLLV